MVDIIVKWEIWESRPTNQRLGVDAGYATSSENKIFLAVPDGYI